MTTRRQVLLAIVPVFAALALVGNGFTYFLHRQATLDGLREQAGAFAVTLSAFRGTGDLARLQAGQPAETVFPAALEKLGRWDMLRNFVVWNASDRRALYRYPEEYSVPLPPANALARFTAQEPFVTSDVVTVDEKRSILVGYAPLLDANGAIGGIVGAAVDATFYAHEVRTLRYKLVRNGLLIVLFGIGVSLLLSSTITRELRRLTRAATGIERGRYVPPPAGVIAEVSDLSHTFGVLEGVIDEVRSKSHRAFVENEQFRTEEDLLGVYRAAFLAPLQARHADVEVGIATTGHGADVFRELPVDSACGRVCFGRVAGPTALETASLASAAGRELEERLARGEVPVDAVLATHALFPLESATVLTWTAGATEVQRTDFRAGAVSLAASTLPAAPAAAIFHNLPPATAAAFEIYTRRFPDEPPAQRLTDLTKLAVDASGIVVVLAR